MHKSCRLSFQCLNALTKMLDFAMLLIPFYIDNINQYCTFPQTEIAERNNNNLINFKIKNTCTFLKDSGPISGHIFTDSAGNCQHIHLEVVDWQAKQPHNDYKGAKTGESWYNWSGTQYYHIWLLWTKASNNDQTVKEKSKINFFRHIIPHSGMNTLI